MSGEKFPLKPSSKEHTVASYVLTSENLTEKKEVTDGYSLSEEEKGKQTKVPFFLSYRMGVALCCAFILGLLQCLQASMGAALVCMVTREEEEIIEDASLLSLEGGSADLQNSSSDSFVKKLLHDRSMWNLDWDKETQGWVLSSFFIGFYVIQFPSGLLAAVFGPYKIVLFGLAGSALGTLLTVPAAAYDVGWLYVVRFATGVFTGILYGPGFALLANWAPVQEINLFYAIAGMDYIGVIFSFLLPILTCQINIQGGWPFVFYIIAGVCIILLLFCIYFVTDSPFNNKRISEKELNYIADYIPSLESKKREAYRNIPVKSILKSRHVWAIVVAEAGGNWMLYLLITVLPQYLDDVLKLGNFEASLLTGLPLCGMAIGIHTSGVLSNYLANHGYVSITTIRKANDTISKLVPSICYVILGYISENSIWGPAVLGTLAATSLWCLSLSWQANPTDLAPMHTGFIVGICQMGSAWVSIVIPILFEYITKDRDRDQWQFAFYLTLGIQILTLIFYLIFGSGERQPWGGRPKDIEMSFSSENGSSSGSDIELQNMKDSEHSRSSSDSGIVTPSPEYRDLE